MEISENIEPCLVTTPQGFSVSYKNKLLYSKYNPSKAILQAIETLNLLPDTLILCCSAVLDYGLKELKSKLPENCLMLRCDFDNKLLEFSKINTKLSDIQYLSVQDLCNLPLYLNKLGNFKRVIKIDFSAGTTFNQPLYNQLLEACTHSILTFYSNRLTLTKFGRRYSQNLFKNLKQLPFTTPIENFIGNIEKPIIVCGAGQSLNNGIKDFKKNRKDFFILCADTALQPLLKNKIIPDGVFIEEAQHIITKAFLGTTTYKTQVFSGLSAINQISHFIDKKRISFFTTEYIEADFLENLKSKAFLPVRNKPFGSVGITAVYYALKFRKNESVPVFIYGLDFSYSAGITHAKSALAHNLRLINSNRLFPVQNYAASFNKNSIKITDKADNTFYTSPAMQNYAKIFNSFFENIKNLFDSSDCGIKLNIERRKPYSVTIPDIKKVEPPEELSEEKVKALNEYFEQERSALLEAKALLTGKINLSEKELKERITEIIKPREYLYLHFPDGNRFEYSQSFLNRVRTEIDFFLKIF